MSEAVQNASDSIRRSLRMEFVDMENVFDKTATLRDRIVGKMMDNVDQLKLVGEDGSVSKETDTGLRVISTTLKALSDVEKAKSTAISLKLKNNEQEVASQQATKERLEIVLRATAPGKIDIDFPAEELESKLEEMFSDDIQDFEMRESPRDLSD